MSKKNDKEEKEMVLRRLKNRTLLFTFIIIFSLLVMPFGVSEASKHYTIDTNHHSSLQQAFTKAAKEFHVPESLLMSVAYNESRWLDHHGQPSTSGGYGIMHLTEAKPSQSLSAKGNGIAHSSAVNVQQMYTLKTAAKLLGVKDNVLKVNPEQNIRGGAALLVEYARDTVGHIPKSLADWYGAVAKYSGSNNQVVANDFADQVYATIQEGAEEVLADGQHLVLKPNKVVPNKKTSKKLKFQKTKEMDVDCPKGVDCRYIPAAYKQFSSLTDYGNYDLATRPKDGNDIRYIIIHDTEGSYDSAINWFQDQSYASAHYVIRSSDGQITEMVKPDDVAWQAGNWYFNANSIGIEHEGYAVQGATWYSEQMYHVSAKLVKYLAKKYHVPLDRAHILGHDNIPGLTPAAQTRMHWDPAAYWNWEHFFKKLGEPIHPTKGKKNSRIVTIAPKFKKNIPPLTYQNEQLETQAANFVYLHTEPSFSAPYIGDPALHTDGSPGTTAINDWGDKASTGQSFYVADHKGDWTAIYYGGKKAWFFNPKRKNTVSGKGILVTPKKGLDAIPVYGAAYPEISAYEGTGIPTGSEGKITPLQYTIAAGQVYVATNPVKADYYYAKLFNRLSENKVVKGNDEYYQIFFNHRVAFVKKSDVEVKK